MLRFVDDIALITKNEKKMETALEVIQKCFEEHDPKINLKKPRLRQKSQQRQRLQIQVRNNYTDHVNSYKYLESLIT